jgi:hypothetical protein
MPLVLSLSRESKGVLFMNISPMPLNRKCHDQMIVVFLRGLCILRDEGEVVGQMDIYIYREREREIRLNCCASLVSEETLMFRDVIAVNSEDAQSIKCQSTERVQFVISASNAHSRGNVLCAVEDFGCDIP